MSAATCVAPWRPGGPGSPARCRSDWEGLSLPGGPDGETPLRDSLLLAGHCVRDHQLVIADGMRQPTTFWPCALGDCVSIGSRARGNTCAGTSPCPHLLFHTCAFSLPRPVPG